MIKSHLSLRLKEVASFVKKDARLADIGSDHAFLPTYLMEEGQIDFAVAGEVVKGPFEIAKSHVLEAGLSDRIHVRLANGLAAIQEADKIDSIVIAGMGGLLISEILEAGLDKIHEQTQLILQPNNHEDTLREWLMNNSFAIEAEKIVLDADKFYEIIVAKKTSQAINYTAEDLHFGPYLRKEKSDVFVKRWTKEMKTRQAILQHLPDSTMPKYEAVLSELTEIEQVLK